MWLCIRFPSLLLESVWHDPQKCLPLAVIEQQQVVCVNPQALAQGIQVGQSVATAYAIEPELKVIERNLLHEQAQLQYMALLAYPFSSQVCICSAQSIALEIGRSLLLFGNGEALLHHIRVRFESLHYQIRLGLGHTVKAAELLSFSDLSAQLNCFSESERQLDKNGIMRLVKQLPIVLLPFAPSVQKNFSRLGFQTINDLLVIPAAALQKRFNQKVLDYCERMQGSKSDPFDYFVPSICFERHLEFLDVIHQAEGLIFPMQRLITELVEFLRLHQKNAQHLLWIMQDTYQRTSSFSVHLTEADINASVYTELTRLHLQRVQLTGPIEQLQLKVEQLSDIAAPEVSLFQLSESFNNREHFVNKIKARFGDNSCLRFTESCQQVPELQAPLSSRAKLSSRTNHQTLKLEQSDESERELAFRPSWLLSTPQRIQQKNGALFWQEALQVISQEERIHQYWWKKTVNRGYFVAQQESGPLLWIFFDYSKQQWFVHGFF